MDYTIELLFEDIPLEHVIPSILDVSNNGTNINSIEIHEIEQPPSINLNNIDKLEEILATQNPVTIFITIKSIFSEKFTIKNCTLLIKKNKNSFDFIFIFDQSDMLLTCEPSSFILHLKDWALHYKKTMHAKMTCCGLESVYDQETRFFTDETIGPLIS